jgi:hypothetical protein
VAVLTPSKRLCSTCTTTHKAGDAFTTDEGFRTGAPILGGVAGGPSVKDPAAWVSVPQHLNERQVGAPILGGVAGGPSVKGPAAWVSVPQHLNEKEVGATQAIF